MSGEELAELLYEPLEERRPPFHAFTLEETYVIPHSTPRQYKFAAEILAIEARRNGNEDEASILDDVAKYMGERALEETKQIAKETPYIVKAYIGFMQYRQRNKPKKQIHIKL